ncbi:MAG: DEAD/DEAH box helicase [archaeon]
MDELQATIVSDELFVWGFSSHTDEVFTPYLRLEKIYDELGMSGKECSAEIMLPYSEEKLVVSQGMQIFYSQYDVGEITQKKIIVKGIELDKKLIFNIFLNNEKQHGISFGDSYDFLRLCAKFALSLVSRERFVPFHNENRSAFSANFDNTKDYEIFLALAHQAPLSIGIDVSKNNSEEIVKAAINFFVELIVQSALEKISIRHNNTDTDKWLIGLCGKYAALSKEIANGLDEWLAIRKVNKSQEFSLMFRLIEPEEGKWALSFNIQSRKDPSLIYNLSDIWKSKSAPVTKVFLLSELGAASKYSKVIERALYKPSPAESILSDDEAHFFMINDSFFLNDAGFNIQIPKINYAHLKEFRIKVRLKNNGKIAGTGMLGSSLFDFDYTVAIGDLVLSKEEFNNLSMAKQKLVNVNGKWVEINQSDINKVIQFFEKKKLLSLQDTFAAGLNGIIIDEISFPNEIEKKVNGLFNFSGLPMLECPDKIKGSLRPYQLQGYSWMVFLNNLGFGGILADDMGLGKTIQAIAYLMHLGKQSLVICPTSVIGNWQRELKTFAPSLNVLVHHGSKRLTKAAFENEIKNKDVIITSYSTLRIDEELFKKTQWEALILDEAQNIKNCYTKQALAITKLNANGKFCLSGTPIENRLSELWSLFNFVNPGLLGGWNSFRDNIAAPIEVNGDAVKTEILKRITSPFILRRLKTDKKIIKDLPEKTEIKEYCTLTKEQATLYQAIVDDTLIKAKEDANGRRAVIMAALIKLKQVCNHPSNYLKDTKKLGERSGKVARLRELVKDILENNEKCLIFTQYTEMGEMLKLDLEEIFDEPVLFLHGSLDRTKREKMIDIFQSIDNASPRIFILSLKAGGLGINLTKANHVIHFDRWWNPAVENQATDRAYRIGQEKNVFAYKFIAEGTIEEKIDDMIIRKLYLSDSVLTKGDTAITELDNESLKEILSLRKNYLEE